VLAHRAKSYSGDPTGPAGRNIRFPVRLGFMGVGVEELEDGCYVQTLGLAVQHDSTCGKPVTVKDYTEIVENQRPLPGSACLHFSNNGKRDGQVDSKKTWTSDTPKKVMKA